MTNPGINELQNDEQFELVAELDHKEIKEFVLDQLSTGGKLVKFYMVYQLLMGLIGLFVFVWATVQAFKNNAVPLIYVLAALLFSFSFLIVIHELLHGIALKQMGAPKVNYGAYLKKFIFYAEADQHVMNKKEFTIIALTPLVVVKIVTLLGLILFYKHPVVFLFMTIMCTHSLFCAGDIGLLALFYKNEKAELFTYDVKSEKKSYFFKRKECRN
ncbi:DUF3267 domain-containing protein [uncultured Draconibacterium sp.]|uniref:DUF3267 domain-containing protein n=1 Tax=uncultured Draconibacterium sp. TaxID=1573823 RepID=UPI0032170A5B